MSIEQTEVIDFATINRGSGDVWLTISDHLPWDRDEGTHLQLLQEKLNAYLRFIESGEIFDAISDSRGRHIVINFIGKYPLSPQAERFLALASTTIKEAGFQLRFSTLRAE